MSPQAVSQFLHIFIVAAVIWLVVLVAMAAVATRPSIALPVSKLDAFIVPTPIVILVACLFIGIPPRHKWLIAVIALASYLSAMIAVLLALTRFSLTRYRESKGIRCWFRITQCLATMAMSVGVMRSMSWETQTAMRLIPSTVGLPMEPAGEEGTPLVAQLSDLHLVKNGQLTTQDGSRPGNLNAPALLKAIAARRPGYLIVTGDITDSGAVAEWEMASRLFKEFHERTPTTQIILAPGNHDLGLVYERWKFSLAQYPLEFSVRVPRFLTALGQVNGEFLTADHISLAQLLKQAPPHPDEAQVEFLELELEQEIRHCEMAEQQQSGFRQYPGQYGYGSMPGTSPSDRAQCVQAASMRFGASPIARAYFEWRAYWVENEYRHFPLVEKSPDGATEFIVLASEPAKSIGENAVGHLESRQLKAFYELLNTVPASVKSLFVLYHHPVVLLDHEQDRFVQKAAGSLGERWTALQDSLVWADTFLESDPDQCVGIVQQLESLQRRRADLRIYFLYGHRHRRTLSTRNQVTYIEAPNAANDSPGIFYIAEPGAEHPATVSWEAMQHCATVAPQRSHAPESDAVPCGKLE